VSLTSDPKTRSCFWSLFVTAALICGVYFFGTVFLAQDYSMPQSLEVEGNGTKIMQEKKPDLQRPEVEGNGTKIMQEKEPDKCKNQCRAVGTEALPEGILAKTSNLEMRPLWGPVAKSNNAERSVNLLAIAVGLKQREVVKEIVEKFLAHDFVVMLFHYDGVVDEWRDLGWSTHVIHVSAINQTKWWFAKRFLHPDIVHEYDYIFLWDEDLGVENFDPGRYLSIVKDEGLEISQPALDPAKSEVHHQITARTKRSRVHRRFYKSRGNGRCDNNSTAPPCVGWVEMMAPVFSRAAWRCAWYMVQNDLIHAWGLDMQLGYCAQGDRTKNVGVVDSEYLVHMGLPTLGGLATKKAIRSFSLELQASSTSNNVDNRPEVRRQSYNEMRTFRDRWKSAAEEDKCWVDPYQQQQHTEQRSR
ncbi:hypothetical protein RJ639_003578, partial [Escallonia herrerae]